MKKLNEIPKKTITQHKLILFAVLTCSPRILAQIIDQPAGFSWFASSRLIPSSNPESGRGIGKMKISCIDKYCSRPASHIPKFALRRTQHLKGLLRRIPAAQRFY